MQGDIRDELPWMANGTLSAEERARIEAVIAADGEARTALNWEIAMRDAVKAEAVDWEPPAHVLDSVLKRIERAKPAPEPSGFVKFFALVKEAFQTTPKFAYACAIMVVQFAVIGHLLISREDDIAYSETRSTAGAKSSLQFIRVMFAPASTESDLRELLRKANAEIVAGPSQLGDYYLLVEPAQITNAVTLLKGSAKIEVAEVVNALPAKP